MSLFVVTQRFLRKHVLVRFQMHADINTLGKRQRQNKYQYI